MSFIWSTSGMQTTNSIIAKKLLILLSVFFEIKCVIKGLVLVVAVHEQFAEVQ